MYFTFKRFNVIAFGIFSLYFFVFKASIATIKFITKYYNNTNGKGNLFKFKNTPTFVINNREKCKRKT